MTQVEGGRVPVGTQLNGIYEIEKRLAVGGMGEVYVGKVIQTGDRVAIKMILPEHANNETILDLFRREASTLHNLYHEAIVRYYVFSVDPALNRPYLSMEFAAGPSLGDRLREAPLKEERMTVLRQRVAGGLHAAHKLGIVHRDISPDNIILVDGEVGKAKIIDFGIAKSQAAESTLIGSGFAGKLNYVSPEQLGLFGGEVTGKSDIYSLGLVFAQAVIGRPLPMGGSQVEVIEKRRSVPELSDVPEFIRPLIESMIQPDPADRPADMQAVADWTLGGGTAGAALAAAAGGGAVHPRERRRQQQSAREEKKKGAPWLWIVGGGAIAATAAAGAFFVVGGPETGGELAGQVASNGTLSPAPPQKAPAASVGAPAAPSLSAQSPAAPSLSAPTLLQPGAGQGSVRLTEASTAPTGPEAPAVRPVDPVSTAPIAGAPASGELSVPTGGGDSGAISLGKSGGGASPKLAQPDELMLAPAPASGAPADGDVAAPQVATGSPGGLAVPVTGTARVGTGGAEAAPSLLRPAEVALQGGGSAGALPTVPPPDKDPTANAAEPTVATASPGGLAAPAAPGGSGISAAPGGEGLAIPQTGAVKLQTPNAAPAQEPEIASIPAPQNQPPTIETALSGPVSASQGDQVNVRIGSFFDEDGPASLKLDIEGEVPNGLHIRLANGGVAQLYGTPAEFGDYSIRVAAIDPQGLVSQPIGVSLNISAPAENATLRDYILAYNGGDCFLSRPMKLGPKLAQIEVFASKDKLQPVLDFDAAFKRDRGFEANIQMRPLSPDQCPLIHALDQVGPQALDNSLAILLAKDELASGDRLTGKIRGGQGARLFLYDASGGVTDLSKYIETRNGETGFSVPLTASGPQILIAARPREGGASAATAGLEQLLGAAQRGQAALALGFFMIKG